MPWTKGDARRHTKKAKSAVSKRQWSHVANSMLDRGYDEGRAIAAANSVVKKRGMKRQGKRGSKK
jgi:uncharacterized protein YdaT